MSLADNIEELKTICHCGKKATINARVIDDEIVIKGNQVEIGGNDLYVSLCRKCYKERKLTANKL
jgi:thymidine kinase